MAGKSKRKFKGIILIITIIIIVAIFAVYLIPGLNFKLPFTYNTKTTSTEVILREINKISTLSTVEYIYKSVFPFDFIDKDTDWRQLVSKRKNNELLTILEKDQLWLFDQCMSIGIDLEYDIYDFVVITSVVEAGLNIEDGIDPDDIIIDGKTISLKMPQTIITKFTIEDSESSKYNYPDLDVAPINWKQITNYVEGKIRLKVLEDGILKNAETRGNDFIKSILLESGWESIVFIK